jgi:SOS-response transcriptional repressor LexA
MMTPAELLRRIKERFPEMGQTELADMLELSQSSISRIANGASDVRRSTVEKLIAVARREGILTNADTVASSSTTVNVVGVVGLGETIEWLGDETTVLGEIEAPFPLAEGCVALEARGDSQFPRVRDGELVIVRPNASVEDLIGEEAVVRLEDGSHLLKTLRRGYEPGTFNLEAFNARTRENVRVAWAAEVVAIVPRRRWRRL